MKAIYQALANPARVRILQQIALTPEVTAGELLQALPDIPQASLYRHLKLLEKSDLVDVTSHQKIRGAAEKHYCMARDLAGDESREAGSRAVLGLLLSLVLGFTEYFGRPDADPVKDAVGASTCALWLSDDEYEALGRGLGELIGPALSNPPTPQRRLRQLAIVFAPPENSDAQRKDDEIC